MVYVVLKYVYLLLVWYTVKYRYSSTWYRKTPTDLFTILLYASPHQVNSILWNQYYASPGERLQEAVLHRQNSTHYT